MSQVAYYLDKGFVNLNSIFVTDCNIGAPRLRIFAYVIGNKLFPTSQAGIFQSKARRII
jgi:hypothetical protein